MGQQGAESKRRQKPKEKDVFHLLQRQIKENSSTPRLGETKSETRAMGKRRPPGQARAEPAKPAVTVAVTAAVPSTGRCGFFKFVYAYYIIVVHFKLTRGAADTH